MLPADLSSPGVAAVHDVVRHQEEGLQELHCPAQDVGQPVQYTIMITFWENKAKVEAPRFGLCWNWYPDNPHHPEHPGIHG